MRERGRPAHGFDVGRLPRRFVDGVCIIFAIVVVVEAQGNGAIVGCRSTGHVVDAE